MGIGTGTASPGPLFKGTAIIGGLAVVAGCRTKIVGFFPKMFGCLGLVHSCASGLIARLSEH